MKKYIIAVLSIMICVFSFIGCSSKNITEQSTSIADYPAAIMVNDTIFLLGQSMPAEIDDSAIIGYTNSYTDSFPSKNGETNFNRELNMPYAQVEGGIAVLYENEWCLCTPKEEMKETSNSQDYFNAVVLEVNDDTILVKCTDNKSGVIPTESEVLISTNTISSEEVPILNVGDSIRVVYIGKVMETYPLQLNEVISIFWVDENGEIVTEPVNKTISELDNPNWGITLTAENINPTGLTIKCTQSGGEPTGELQTGSDFVIERFTNEAWEKVDYILDDEMFGWTAEAWIIPMDDICEWEVNWEWLYGTLPEGKYRIGKTIMDFRGSGDFDTATHYAEFEITE